jgi:hypothetical protein
MALKKLREKYALQGTPLDARRTQVKLAIFLQEMRQKHGKKADKSLSAGFFAVMLNTTDMAASMSFPLKTANFLTGKSGQVAHQRTRPNKILKEWGIEPHFGTEQGGTSRGSIDYMQDNIAYLNHLYEANEPIYFLAAMAFWVKQTKLFFENKPVEVPFVPANTIRSFLRRLIEEIKKRERRVTGTKLLGLTLQHLVGAKLEMVLGEGKVTHHHSNQSDLQYDRQGDFEIGTKVIHVTTAPTESLMEKCRANIQNKLQPVIVTLHQQAVAAESLAVTAELSDQIEVIEIESFMVHNLLEVSLQGSNTKKQSVENLIANYNRIARQYDGNSAVSIALKLQLRD